jgi:MFS family permease
MKLALEILVWGGAIPAAVALVLAAVAHRAAPAAARRYGASLAAGCAFFVGYVLLPEWAPLVPARHWHWLPYIAIIAAFASPLARAPGLHWIEGCLLHLLTGLVAAWLVVPTWADLVPPRPTSVALVTGGIFLLTACLEPLAAKERSAFFAGHLAAAAAVGAGCLAYFQSATFGQLAGIASAALAGTCAAACLTRGVQVQGLAGVYSVAVGGCLYTGAVTPKPPMVGFLLLAAAPLGLWTGRLPQVARRSPLTSAAVQSAAVLVVDVISVWLLWTASSVEPWE